MVENAASLIEGLSQRDVVLASETESRRKLLTAAGIAFRIVEPDVDEAAIHEALFKDNGEMDPEAARQLLGSHLRQVVKIARGFGGYGMPLADLVAEGNVGLMRALARFEPERGFRFATYAMWWDPWRRANLGQDAALRPRRGSGTCGSARGTIQDAASSLWCLNTLPFVCCELVAIRESLLAVSAAQAPGDHFSISTEDIGLKIIYGD